MKERATHNAPKRRAIVKPPRRSAQILAVLGRLGLAFFKALIIAVIVWRVALYALESKSSPYVEHITIGAFVVLVAATIYFLIWPSPLGDARDWDEIIHVPPPPERDEATEEADSVTDDDDRSNR